MNTTDTEYRQIKATDDESLIIKTLLDSSEHFVSGSMLAEKLKISRSAIWGKLEKLRKAGFEFEAIRNKGYRLTVEPEIIHPALVNYYLQKTENKTEILYFPVIDSTNSEAERQISYGRKSPFAIVSSCQTKGRGRLGRDWFSAAADNLYLSVLFEPNITPQRLQHFTLWAGVYISRELQSLVPNVPIRIKWPNDLQCDGRKFAGMLTEAKMDSDSLRSIVFGIGINLNSNPSKFPSDIKLTATSLRAVSGKNLPINQTLSKIINAIQLAYESCIQNKTTEKLSDAWAPLNSLNGQEVTAIIGNKKITGIADGIDESGALLLRKADGTIHPLRSGDVTLKK